MPSPDQKTPPTQTEPAEGGDERTSGAGEAGKSSPEPAEGRDDAPGGNRGSPRG